MMDCRTWFFCGLLTTMLVGSVQAETVPGTQPVFSQPVAATMPNMMPSNPYQAPVIQVNMDTAEGLLQSILNVVVQLQASVNNNGSKIDKLNAGYGEGMADALFAPTPMLDVAMALNTGIGDIGSWLLDYPEQETQAVADQILSLKDTSSDMLNKYPATDVLWIQMASMGRKFSEIDARELPKNAELNIASLSHPTSYSPSQAALAQLFIEYLSTYAHALPTPSFMKDQDTTSRDLIAKFNENRNNAPKILSDPTIANYIYNVRAYTAMNSVIVDALYQSLARRQPQQQLGNKSVLEIEASRSDRRVNNPDWYQQMEKASPATLQREQLYIMAEMLQELHKQRQEIEQLKFINASLQVGMLQLWRKTSLEDLAEEAQKSYNALMGIKTDGPS